MTDALRATALADATAIADLEKALATIVFTVKADTRKDLYNPKNLAYMKSTYNNFIGINE